MITALAGVLRVPTLIHLHGAQFDLFYRGLSRPGRAAARWMFGRASRVIVLGASWRDFVVSEIGVPSGRVQIIYNGVPAPSVGAVRRTGNFCQVVFLGRLGARKGVPELLQALASADVVDQPWRATLAGDGDVEWFRDEVQRLGLNGRVQITGWVSQQKVSELLEQADIFVLPSHQEGLPVAVLEALAHKVAVIATPVGALPEVLVDGTSALMVAPGKVGELAAALSRLISDPTLRARIAEGGHALFREQFDVSQMARAFSGAYIDAANGA
jgi:glycosyltransferase involved in cell wall biosynthesis